MFTFIPHSGDVIEPLFDCGNAVWGVFMPPAGDFGYGGHWAFKWPTGFSHHGVMTKMEVQCLNDVGGIIFGAWM